MTEVDPSRVVSSWTFAQIPDEVIYAPISDRAVRLFAMLHKFSTLPHGAIPGRLKIAGLLSCSVDSVDRALRELVESGFVSVHQRWRTAGGEIVVSDTNPGGQQASNLYELMPGWGRTVAAPRGGKAAAPRGRTGAARSEISGNKIEVIDLRGSDAPASDQARPDESEATKTRKSAIRKAIELNEDQARLFVEFRDVISVGFKGRKGSKSQQERVKSLIRLGAVREDFDHAIEVAKSEPRDDGLAFALAVVARCIEDRNEGKDPYAGRNTGGRRSGGGSVRRGGSRTGSRDRPGNARRDGGGTGATAVRVAEPPAVRRLAPID